MSEAVPAGLLRHRRCEGIQGFHVTADFRETVLEKRHCRGGLIGGCCRQSKIQRAIPAARDSRPVRTLVDPFSKTAHAFSDKNRVGEFLEWPARLCCLGHFGLDPAKCLLDRETLLHPLALAEWRYEGLQVVRQSGARALVYQPAGLFRIRIEARHRA